MDFVLNAEQNILKKSARQFLANECTFEFAKAMSLSVNMPSEERGFPPDLYRKIVDMGWTGLPIPEEYGGAGANIVDMAVVFEEIGRVNLPSLVFTAVVLGGLTILEAGSEQQKAELLPKVAEGELIATLALLEAGLRYEPSSIRSAALANGTGFSINGTKLFVPDADVADYIITVARTSEKNSGAEGLSLLMAKSRAPGMGLTPLKPMAGDKQFEVIFSDTPGELLGTADTAWPALGRVLQVAAVAKCAEMVGASERIKELAVEQGHNRVQFGRPVGSFQAIQHHCADILINFDLSRLMTYRAAWALSERKTADREVSAAKSFVSDAYMRTVKLGHQILGGNGLIQEHEMHLFSYRAPAYRQYFGNSDYHRDLVVRELGL